MRKKSSQGHSMIQLLITPAAGKRLIARATAALPEINEALKSGTVAIIAGTTNGYVAEEILKSLGRTEGFTKDRFVRGIVGPPRMERTDSGRLPDESRFPGDVVIVRGIWQKGKTIFEVVDDMKEGDIILKGANCIGPERDKAGIFIGHPKGGTIGAALQAVVGRRVRLIIPVGLEKRIPENVDDVAARINAVGSSGPRMLPVLGRTITEIEAVSILSGAKAFLVAGGGVCGAEGSIWLGVEGGPDEIEMMKRIHDSIAGEPPFST